MTYTFKIKFSELFEELEDELKPNEYVYTKITKFTNWTHLTKSNSKYRDVKLTVVYEPHFQEDKTNRLDLTIWYRKISKTFYATLRQPYSAVFKVTTKEFKLKEYQKLLKLLNKYKGRKAIEI